MKLRKRGVLPALAAALCVAVSVGFWTASANPAPAVQADAPSPLVEDFSYPGADAIEAQYGVTLISGDGHIVFADCGTPVENGVGVLQVRTSETIGADGAGLICFKILGVPGHLDLMVPAVYEIRGDGRTSGAGHKVKAELTTDDGDHTTVNVNPSGSTPVGIGASPNNEPTTLLSLDATT
ncbi:hypothetical protein GCM10017786_20730 [Amycolatopsis deserti]|uniref:Secreted protein n=1 Tax=Amycolatopsis deserti TaxID=185696 RepID=A0ABQ3IPR3_9PSEU|nr:hypothetical protein [Amycolatopsis deserti]GHE88584.1 hypothetical protein GCM10017786_20730 [Amycolatopsis deserti]